MRKQNAVVFECVCIPDKFDAIGAGFGNQGKAVNANVIRVEQRLIRIGCLFAKIETELVAFHSAESSKSRGAKQTGKAKIL